MGANVRRAALTAALAVWAGVLAACSGSAPPALDIGLRTHEILENALEFQLTGHDDYGSGTTLATTQANIAGTLELLTVLHPLLTARYPGLPAVYTWLERLRSLLDQGKRPHGSWLAVSLLSQSHRQQVDAGHRAAGRSCAAPWARA